MEIRRGMVVGATYRVPFQGAHPDCWGKPWRGVVLDYDDPRAWAGTLAFPSSRPSAKAVKAHVARMAELYGAETEIVPVKWDFGKVYFEHRSSLVPYGKMCRDVKAERMAEYARRSGLRLVGAVA